MLLRVVAAGPEGIPVARLVSAMWPELPERSGRRRFEEGRRCLAGLLAIGAPPVRVEADVASIDAALLDVDSIRLEESLAPLLQAFRPVAVGQLASARTQLGLALAAHPVFLPGCDADWARAARHRIADAMARAARRLACGEPALES